jgi:hypothetical protein
MYATAAAAGHVNLNWIHRMADYQGGQVPCPECKRKGCGYAPHPHAHGYKDYTRARCRYCGHTFKIPTIPATPFESETRSAEKP